MTHGHGADVVSKAAAVTPATDCVGEFTECGEIVSRIERDAVVERESFAGDGSIGDHIQFVVV